MRLIDALRLSPGTATAFVGAGGKTSAIFIASREYTASGKDSGNRTALVTTTTHLGAWQAQWAEHYIRISTRNDFLLAARNLPNGVVLLAGDENDNRLRGLSPDILELVQEYACEHQIPLLIEADGAALHPLKAPAEHEPAIPDCIHHVVVVAGLSGLGKPISSEWVHRPEIFATLAKIHMGDEITLDGLSKVLVNQQGGLKNIPQKAGRVLLLNQADTSELQAQARRLAEKVIPEFHSVIIASLEGSRGRNGNRSTGDRSHTSEIYAVVERIAGVILAAGGSSRLGEAKQLLLWKGEPFIRHVVRAAIAAGLSPLVVVTGAASDKVLEAIHDLPVQDILNPEWTTGLSSSIKVGLTALPIDVGGAVFLPADKPHISPALLTRLVEVHTQTLDAIVAPMIDGERSNPVLFDRHTFSDLATLSGDRGGKTLFSRYPVRWETWHDPRQLIDIDTPEEYINFLENYGDGQDVK